MHVKHDKFRRFDIFMKFCLIISPIGFFLNTHLAEDDEHLCKYEHEMGLCFLWKKKWNILLMLSSCRYFFLVSFFPHISFANLMWPFSWLSNLPLVQTKSRFCKIMEKWKKLVYDIRLVDTININWIISEYFDCHCNAQLILVRYDHSTESFVA